jgi:hypothetical protein
MAFNDFDMKRIEKAMDAFLAKRRPPAHIRTDLDIGYRISGQSVETVAGPQGRNAPPPCV